MLACRQDQLRSVSKSASDQEPYGNHEHHEHVETAGRLAPRQSPSWRRHITFVVGLLSALPLCRRHEQFIFGGIPRRLRFNGDLFMEILRHEGRESLCSITEFQLLVVVQEPARFW